MKRKKKVNLDDVKTFYDPHPGYAGATIPIPPAVKKVADEINGKKLTLRDAKGKIQAVTEGEVGIVEELDYISLSFTIGDMKHYFRVIRYR